jgi:hypothetical protein
MNTTQSKSEQSVSRILKYGLVKEHFSLKDELTKIDLLHFIRLTGMMLKKQKEYFSCQDKELRKRKLIECKELENRIRKIGNELYLKYR